MSCYPAIASAMQHPPFAIGTPLGLQLLHSLNIHLLFVLNVHNTYKTNKTICDHCSYVHVCRNKLDGMSSNITLHGMIEIRTSRSNHLTFHHSETSNHSETSKRHINAIPTPKHIKSINFINMLCAITSCISWAAVI